MKEEKKRRKKRDINKYIETISTAERKFFFFFIVKNNKEMTKKGEKKRKKRRRKNLLFLTIKFYVPIVKKAISKQFLIFFFCFICLFIFLTFQVATIAEKRKKHLKLKLYIEQQIPLNCSFFCSATAPEQ